MSSGHHLAMVHAQHRPSGAGEDRNHSEYRPLCMLVSPQHRPSGAGEDRNSGVVVDSAFSAVGQHRPSGAGEDRNSAWAEELSGLTWQHRPSGAGEDRNARGIVRSPFDCEGSTGPPGPARIATRDNDEANLKRISGQHRPSGAGEDRNDAKVKKLGNYVREAAPALRGRRGSQLQLRDRVAGADAGSTGPPGPARIATLPG